LEFAGSQSSKLTLGQYSSGADSSAFRVPGQFFKVRAWNSSDLIEPPMESYDKLNQDIRSELPLKRILTLVTPEV
jgi:predicted Mrr-cat superfamily restriction endonuclease